MVELATNINRVYSILMQGHDPKSSYFQRAVDLSVKSTSLMTLAEALVPPSDNPSYRAYAAEQLVQVCRHSLLAARLGEIDPVNTYANEFAPIVPATAVGSLPAGVVMELAEPDMRHQWVDQLITLSVDPLGVATINEVPVPFTVTANLTSVMPLVEGVTMRLRGILPPSTFSTTISLVRVPQRDLVALLERLRMADVPWLTAYTDYRSSRSVNDWLAAFVLNYCETVDGP